MRTKKTFLFLLLMLVCMGVSAEIKMSPLFTSNMVMQQQTDAPMWGTATPKHSVKVVTSWDGQKYATTADENGRWRVSVKTPSAGGPYEITVSDGKSVKLKNVMIGEVWICSGQSNMEMPVKGWGKVMNFEAEIANANHPNIRLLTVEKAISQAPAEDFKATGGGWLECSSASIPEFSAAAYFFGRDLQEHLNVPIGLINTSWGGTYAEAWTNSEMLSELPDFAAEAQRLSNLPTDKAQCEQDCKAALAQWQADINDFYTHRDVSADLFLPLSYDDSAWNDIKVPGYSQSGEFENFVGWVWLRHVVDIPEGMKGKALKLCLGGIDDDDYTYFNGKKVGQTNGYANLREYDVPAELTKDGKAVILIRLVNTGGLLGITGFSDRQCELKAADGTSVSLNGTWKVRLGGTTGNFAAQPRNPQTDQHSLSSLYNGMINPLIPYAFKGAIWYQGENNQSRAWQYRDVLAAMIKGWREKWNSDFPFYIVQLANYKAQAMQPEEATWAELREAQDIVAKSLSNCGMSCTIDIGDANDIHPKNKQEVGHRLALIARDKVYRQDVVSSGPTYSHYVIENGRIRIFFNNVSGGLGTSDGSSLKGFTIAGADHKYHNADAVIDGESVVVSAKDVKHPVAVRYAWAHNPLCNLVNAAKLPAFPFRTDDWQGITYPAYK